MQTTRQRGGRVVYVAGSTRDFPETVQAWLSQAHVRASASPNLYDALALLTTHRRPDVLIVAMEGVDWSEMEFFEHARRIARDTCVYVTGGAHQQEKMRTAQACGALPFDPARIAENLADAGRPESRFTTRDLWVGMRESLAAPPVPSREETPPAPEPPPAPCEEATRQPRSVRLVPENDRVERSEPPEPATDATEASIPFPWSPSPTRPKRTPPQSRPPKPAEPPAEAAPAADPSAEKGPTRPGPDVGPVELTPEELAALMGRRPPDSSSPPREGPP